MKTTTILITLLCLSIPVFAKGEIENINNDYIEYSDPDILNKKITPWTIDEIIGYRIELLSNEYVEIYRFSENKHAAATIGTKKYLAGPVMEWNLDDLGRLIISSHDTIPMVIEKIDLIDGILSVYVNGKIRYYRYRKY